MEQRCHTGVGCGNNGRGKRRRCQVLRCDSLPSREMAMRFLLLTIGLVASSAAMSSSAQAQNYPWCAVLNMGDAAYNCGFVTVQQCMDSVRGIGGFCTRNNTYRAPEPNARRPYAAH